MSGINWQERAEALEKELDALIADAGIQALEKFAATQEAKAEKYHELSPGCAGEGECLHAAGQALQFAQQLREAKA